jgi:hypothetical protein
MTPFEPPAWAIVSTLVLPFAVWCLCSAWRHAQRRNKYVNRPR